MAHVCALLLDGRRSHARAHWTVTPLPDHAVLLFEVGCTHVWRRSQISICKRDSTISNPDIT